MSESEVTLARHVVESVEVRNTSISRIFLTSSALKEVVRRLWFG